VNKKGEGYGLRVAGLPSATPPVSSPSARFWLLVAGYVAMSLCHYAVTPIFNTFA